MLQIILFVISRIFNRGLILIDNTILPMFMIPTCYFLGEVLSKKKSMQRSIQKLNEYGMGIYLYAEPLNYLLLYIAVEGFGVNVLGNEGYVFMILLLRIFDTVAVAMVIVCLIRLLRIKYIS